MNVNVKLSSSTHQKLAKKLYAPPVLIKLPLPGVEGAATNRIAESTNGLGPIATGS